MEKWHDVHFGINGFLKIQAENKNTAEELARSFLEKQVNSIEKIVCTGVGIEIGDILEGIISSKKINDFSGEIITGISWKWEDIVDYIGEIGDVFFYLTQEEKSIFIKKHKGILREIINKETAKTWPNILEKSIILSGIVEELEKLKISCMYCGAPAKKNHVCPHCEKEAEKIARNRSDIDENKSY